MLKHLSRDACRLIAECAHIKLKQQPQTEDNDMCLAIEEMIQDRIKEKDKQIQTKEEQLQKQGQQLQKKEKEIINSIKRM